MKTFRRKDARCSEKAHELLLNYKSARLTLLLLLIIVQHVVTNYCSNIFLYVFLHFKVAKGCCKTV